MSDVADALDRLLPETERRLRALVEGPDEASVGAPRAPGAWSRKEVLGHLIDSATHNLHRVVRAQLEDGVRLLGYDQDAWVRVQGYRDAPWAELVAAWVHGNRHLARVLRGIPPARRSHRCAIDDGPWVPLDAVARDYVVHLRHHLDQILGPRR